MHKVAISCCQVELKKLQFIKYFASWFSVHTNARSHYWVVWGRKEIWYLQINQKPNHNLHEAVVQLRAV